MRSPTLFLRLLCALAALSLSSPALADSVRIDVRDMSLEELREHVDALTDQPLGEGDTAVVDGADEVTSEVAERAMQFIAVKYADATQLAPLLDAPEARVDERTNTLVVRGTPEEISRARMMVERLDVPVRQVLIEARIVIASEDFSDEIGVQFGVAGEGSVGGTSVSAGGSLGRDGLLVDLPTGNAAGAAGVAIGKVGSYLLELELSAMESENRGEIVSSPRVVTASNRQAEIKQGVQIPFEQATSSGATSITFREAVLGLVVTPRITPDDRVQLELAVNQDSRGEETPEGPAINTQAVRTNVLVADGETVVLGGVFEQTRREGFRRVPLLADIPVMGGLFERRIRVDDRSELLVFVTPRIIEAPEAAVNALDFRP